MKKSLPMMVTTMVCVNVAFWSMTGRAQPEPQDPQQEGVATKAAEKLDDFGRAIKRGILNAEESVRDGLNKTGETVRESFAKTRDTVQSMGIPSRVYGRLHWDKEFHEHSAVRQGGGRDRDGSRDPSGRCCQSESDRADQRHRGRDPRDRPAQRHFLERRLSVPPAAKRSVKTSTVENRDPE